jgi:hypothetical protein
MRRMSASIPKKPAVKRPISGSGIMPRAKPAHASQLSAQTRRVLNKHYRAKYGVK